MNRRSYAQYCGVARALDVVGERWTLLIVRDLLLGPRRYSDLLRGLPGITTNLLARRLQEMEAAGLLERVRTGPSDGGHAYRLTPLGQGLEGAVQALASWGWHTMDTPKRGEQKNIEWMLVALRPRYRGGTVLRAELIADGAPYRMVLDGKHADVSRGEVSAPDLRLRGTSAALYRLFREPPARGVAPAGVEVEGPLETVRKLVNAFAIEELTFA
jgi:DNA-binding HxlR family transcriptional regulator